MKTNNPNSRTDSRKPSTKSSKRNLVMLHPTHRKEGETRDEWINRVVDQISAAAAKMK